MIDPRIATTPEFLVLCRLAEGRNRSVDIDALEPDIHPDGLHLLQFAMLHNDVEHRTYWMVRLNDGTKRPGVRETAGISYVELWLDMPIGAHATLRRASEFM